MRRWMRMMLVAAVLGTMGVPAWAHAELDKATPKVGEKVARAPAVVTLAFTEDLQMDGSDVQVFDAQGKEVDRRDAHLDADDGSTLVVSLEKKLPAGKYTVKWRAHCVFDHRTEGSFHFVVEGGGTARGD